MSFMRPISVLLGINCNNTEKTQQIVVSMEIHELYIYGKCKYMSCLVMLSVECYSVYERKKVY